MKQRVESTQGIVNHPRRLGADEAGMLARELWGLGDASVLAELPSERDQNFLVAAGGAQWVLKVAAADDSRKLLEAQNEALQRVAATTRRFQVPLPRASATEGRIRSVRAQ
jgi:Ser/Thr protein kinase RdoA (MazF antagonist)